MQIRCQNAERDLAAAFPSQNDDGISSRGAQAPQTTNETALQTEILQHKLREQQLATDFHAAKMEIQTEPLMLLQPKGENSARGLLVCL